MAPETEDKIYVPVTTKVLRRTNEWSGVIGMPPMDEKPVVENVEFVRKKALLEWAEEKKKELLEGELTDVAAGINAGLDMLIGKLNSM